MKFFYFSVFFIFCFFHSFSQCNNKILFIIDDSGSISFSERIDMQNSIQTLSNQLYTDNPLTEIGIVQYGQPSANPTSQPSYYVSYPFTVNPTIILQDDPGGQFMVQDVLPNSINTMINDGLFSTGGNFEDATAIFLFTDAAVSGSCFSVLANCTSCNVPALSCGYDYLNDLSQSLGGIPISVYRVMDSGTPTSAVGIAQNGGILIEDNNFQVSTNQIDQLINSLACIDGYFEVLDTCLGETTQFNLTTNDTVTSASWDFGDGATSSDFNPTHTYSNPGTYDVSLIISNDTETLTINETVTIYDNPVANPIPDFIMCDDSNDQVELFDLTTRDQYILGSQSDTTFSINYFSSLTDAENNNNPLSTNYYNTNMEEEIFARIENSQNNQCYEITSFNVIVAALPTAFPVADFVVCDDESNDGIASFDLTLINDQVLNGQSSTTFSTSYHSTYIDAIDGTNSLPNNYTNQSANEEVFIRVFNSDYPDCFNITSFNLIVSQQPVANAVTDFIMCENDMFDLDLTIFNQDVLLNQNSSDFSISYYYYQNDAINSVNEINTVVSYDEDMIVFAKVENNNNLDCYAITPIKLTIYRFPFEPYEEIKSCFQKNFTLEANSNSEEASYLWDNGETTESITVNNFGSYEVEITINNCTEVKTIDFIKDTDCIIPQGISPNDDRSNDFLDLSFLDIDSIIIYNRYGTEVYSKNNYINEWKGQTNEGKKLPTGTYFYVIKTLSNKTHTGWVYLNR